jgi:hypothetical protein
MQRGMGGMGGYGGMQYGMQRGMGGMGGMQYGMQRGMGGMGGYGGMGGSLVERLGLKDHSRRGYNEGGR